MGARILPHLPSSLPLFCRISPAPPSPPSSSEGEITHSLFAFPAEDNFAGLTLMGVERVLHIWGVGRVWVVYGLADQYRVVVLCVVS